MSTEISVRFHRRYLPGLSRLPLRVAVFMLPKTATVVILVVAGIRRFQCFVT